MISSVSRASSCETEPGAAGANRPSVDSRRITKSISAARGSASTAATPGIGRTGRTPA